MAEESLVAGAVQIGEHLEDIGHHVAAIITKCLQKHVSPGVFAEAWNAAIEWSDDDDGTGEEFHAGHCWLPEQIAPVIATIRQGEQADGTGVKVLQPSEAADRAWRRDPSDGLRPTLAMREAWRKQG